MKFHIWLYSLYCRFYLGATLFVYVAYYNNHTCHAMQQINAIIIIIVYCIIQFTAFYKVDAKQSDLVRAIM